MRLLKLTVNNFGLFRGRHDFDFMPAREPNGPLRNLIIVKGANGVGKSTLFQAIPLALHGALALGDRVSRQAYNDFLLKRLHRATLKASSSVITDDTLISENASVTVSFQYVQSGIRHHIEVERLFKRNGLIVEESLNILRDGKPPEVDAADYQTWLNDLMPSGLLALCFFDAERLDAFANVEQSNAVLGDALRRLLGLDLIERLQTDLDYYTSNKGGGRKALDRLRVEVLVRQNTVDSLNDDLAKLKAEAEALIAEQRRLEAELEKQEQQLAAEGGAYASRRPMLQERLIVVERDIEILENQLREISAELLPFALAPELCLKLSLRLNNESKVRAQQAADELLQERISDIKEKLTSDNLWRGLRVSSKDRKTLATRITRTLRKTGLSGSVREEPIVHNLSEPESERLQGWIVQATQIIPMQVKTIGKRLRELQEEKGRIQSDLNRAPDDELLAPIYAEVETLESDIEEARRQQDELSQKIGALHFQRDEAERLRQRAAADLEKTMLSEKQLALAERSRASLRAYKDALILQRLAALEKALVAGFNRICRKEHLLGSVQISPDDYTVELKGTDGHRMSLNEFSAGERQLYALALLEALRQVSGYQLPLAIDTPLARLDEIHRHRIINDYVPAVSDQVLLFATDAELDVTLIEEARAYTAREYRLYFHSWNEYTQVICDNCLPQGIILYRGERLDAIESDVLGRYGQVWTTDFEQATCHGKVKRAVLPPDAKRLVLVDPNTTDYNMDGFSELERITGSQGIRESLRKRGQVYEIWCEEWSKALKEAGYDSIATLGLDGIEEYVLNPAKLIMLDSQPVAEEETAFDL